VIRTHESGALRDRHAGESVVLAGWVARRRDHGGVAFLDLRDASGVVQVVVRDLSTVHDLRAEWCVRVVGEVGLRPPGNENPAIPTGAVEVVANAVEVLSESAPLPFPVEGSDEIASGVEERLRWQHRYLDLRRAGPARALRVRSQAVRVIRRVMDGHGFLDVETPTLTRSTPEGARDFLVPVRLQPGSWYALPQSPQLFKQLLMVAGLERYYQIARCYRDEDSRADRTPEFTQLDVELSFLDEEDVYALGEELLATLWHELLGVSIPTPFPRMTYAEALARFGSDRPDTRFALELADVTAVFADTSFRVFQAAHVGALAVPGGGDLTRRQLDDWQEWARSRGARGLAYVVADADGSLRGPVAKNLSDGEVEALRGLGLAAPGDAVFFSAGSRTDALALLGAARLEVARQRGLIPDGRWDFLWVTDFPLFEELPDGGWTFTHHPFTSPQEHFLPTFDTDPGPALSRAYDVVLNGMELGGGSIRIHRRDVQERVLAVLGFSAEQAEAAFGFLLEAFRYGPPPHGGIALGIDRLCAVLAGTEAIREVMAFPKASSGGDPLTGAPTPITAEQRREAGIDAQPVTGQSGG